MPIVKPAFVLIAACLLPAAGARAEPPRVALIIGSSTYSSMPPLPGCARSANALASALRARGFEVTERADASTGGIDAGISEFSQHIAEAGGTAIVYVCGYGSEFNDRMFLLPSTARIARPTDVLTQGVLAKSLLDTVGRKPLASALVVFDLVPQPDGPPKLGVEALTNLAVKDPVAVIAVAGAPSGDRPTPLAAALLAELGKLVVRDDEVVANVRGQLSGTPSLVVAIHSPARADYLIGAPPAPPAAIPPPAEIPALPPPVAVATPALQAPLTTMDLLPDEGQLTATERRKVQAALASLGYYSLSVDGIFGPDTRAAIRRYQHEIHTEMTGRLTAAEANHLIGSR